MRHMHKEPSWHRKVHASRDGPLRTRMLAGDQILPKQRGLYVILEIAVFMCWLVMFDCGLLMSLGLGERNLPIYDDGT